MLHSVLARSVGACALVPLFAACASLQDSAPQDVVLDPMPVEEAVPAPVSSEAEPEERLGFMLGYRSWSDDLFDEADSGVAVGVDYARTNADGLGWEVGGLGSLGSSGGDITSAGAELYGGVRKSFDLDRWRPYVGAGATLLYAGADDEADNQVSDNLDLTPGLYLRGGVLYDIDAKTYVGFDVRAVGATSVDFETADGDADYIQGMVVIGLRL